MTIKTVKQESKKTEYVTVPFEVKQLPEQEDPDYFFFEGHASVFNNVDLVDDIILPGAFAESLSKEMPVILWQHDRWEPVGMPQEAREDAVGLYVVGKMPKADTFVTGRVIPQMKVGSVSQMSIGYRTQEYEMDTETGIRKIMKVKLKEFSLVTTNFAANPLAMVSGFKSIVDDPEKKKEFLLELTKALGGSLKVYNVEDVKSLTVRDFENILRESGLFSKEASIVLANHFKGTGEPYPNVFGLKNVLDDLQNLENELQLKSLNQLLEKNHG